MLTRTQAANRYPAISPKSATAPAAGKLPTFVRTPSAGAIDRKSDAHESPVRANLVEPVIAACAEHGLEPGQKTTLAVDGKTMVFRRTSDGDGHRFQTEHDYIRNPSAGLYVGNDGKVKFDGVQVMTSRHPHHRQAQKMIDQLHRGLAAHAA